MLVEMAIKGIGRLESAWHKADNEARLHSKERLRSGNRFGTKS